MRQRRLGLLLLLLFLSIGFATVTTNVIVNNTATIGMGKFDLYFSNVSTKIYGRDFSGEVSLSEDKKSIVFSTDQLTDVGDEFAILYNVQNASSDYDADVTFNLDYISGEELKDNISVDIFKFNDLINAEEEVRPAQNNDKYLIPARGSEPFVIRIVLKKPVMEERAVEVRLTYDIEPEERTSRIDAMGEEEVETYFNLEPGLYTLGKEQVKTWQELLDEGTIHVNENLLSTNLDSASLGNISYDETADNPMYGMINDISSHNSSCEILKGILVVDENVNDVAKSNLICTGLKAIVYKNDLQDIKESLMAPVGAMYLKNFPHVSLLRENYPTAINPVIIGDYAVDPHDSSRLLAYLGDEKTLTLPSQFKSIGDKTFFNTPVVDLTIPDSVTEFSPYSLIGVKNLYYNGPASQDNNEELPNWGARYLNPKYEGDFIIGGNNQDELLGYVGESKKVVIPEGIEKIGEHCFDGIELEEVILPSTLEEIKNGAFGDIGLTRLEVPSSVTKIEDDAFYGIDTVIYDGSAEWKDNESVLWGADELYGTRDDNFLYTNGGKTIVMYIGESKDVVVPDGIEILAGKSFSDIELNSLLLPSSLKKIGYEALYKTKLSELNIPDSVEVISEDALYDIDLVLYDGPAKAYDSRLWGADELYGTKDENFAYTNHGKYIVDYLGESEDVVVPEGVTGILYEALNSSNIKSVVLPNTLEYIGELAFHGENITSLNIPSSVTQIDYNAFRGINCIFYYGNAKYSEDDMYWGANTLNPYIEDGYVLSDDKKRLFGYVGELKNIVIPNGVEVINDHAFENKEITSVIIPSSVTDICEYAFADSGLTTIEVPDSVSYIGTNAFKGISNLFYHGSAMPNPWNKNWGAQYLNMVIENGFILSDDKKTIYEYIGDSKDIVIPDGIITIGKDAFKSKSLNSVVIPSSVTTIESYAFAFSNLKEIVVPDSVSKIETGAFYGIDILKYYGVASYDSTNKYWGARYLNAVITGSFVISEDGKELEKYIGTETKNIIIPNGIERIADKAFYNHSIYSVIIPDSVTSIGEYAFSFYTDQTLEVPSSVTSIGYHAFGGLYNLKYSGTAIYDQEDEYWGALVMNDGYTEGDFLYTDSSKTKIAKYTGFSNEDLVVMDGVVEIKRGAFQHHGFNSVILPNSIQVIGDEAFYWCRISHPLIIPDSVNRIGDEAFEHVAAIIYNGELSSKNNWGARALNPYIEDSFAYEDNTKKKALSYFGLDSNVIVLDSVEELGDYSFFYAKADSISLSNNLKKIGYGAFFGCTTPIITVPSSFTEIQDSAFAFYDGDEVILPNTITKIGNYSFAYSDIKKVNIPSSVVEIGKYSFTSSEKIESIDFETKEGWKVTKGSEKIEIPTEDMNDMAKLIDYMTNKYKDYTWTRN
ncbi:MAG: leucine-rich repeat domain-containing protein [Bacilli bacterium]|nr:leucine-rich repeat domain-containing protein [Bacilli bacterium]